MIFPIKFSPLLVSLFFLNQWYYIEQLLDNVDELINKY